MQFSSKSTCYSNPRTVWGTSAAAAAAAAEAKAAVMGSNHKHVVSWGTNLLAQIG
jgi:hypothetical protein